MEKCCNSRAMLRKLFTFICAMAGHQHSTPPNPNSSHRRSHHEEHKQCFVKKTDMDMEIKKYVNCNPLMQF